ncbi:MAG: hypothetical protein JW810_12870 [Sedimentisphaerales bacterium]|nr:hypothetical protein [Sedimentisphaerales bacterium]
MGPGWIVLAGLGLALCLTGSGCGSNRSSTIGRQLTRIEVARTDAVTVMDLLDNDSRLQTDESVSVYRRSGQRRELGIVQLQAVGSLVERKTYIQIRSELIAPPFSREQLYLYQQTLLPRELLDQPFESERRKNDAILRYCRNALIEDARPYAEDQNTFSLAGAARAALNEALLALEQNPRQAEAILTDEGFAFTHSIYGPSRLYLRQEAEPIYTLRVLSADWVDPLGVW